MKPKSELMWGIQGEDGCIFEAHINKDIAEAKLAYWKVLTAGDCIVRVRVTVVEGKRRKYAKNS